MKGTDLNAQIKQLDVEIRQALIDLDLERAKSLLSKQNHLKNRKARS